MPSRMSFTTGWYNWGHSAAATPSTPALPADVAVEVAVDAAGPRGGQTFTYAVPAALGPVVPGEAVLVDYGRRRALGVVMAATVEPVDREIKPILARVRSDGPLMPPL